MTGIERLRELARRSDTLAVPLVHGTYCAGYVAATEDMREQLSAIADQIERELTCDADTIENVRLIVGGVIADMERHTLGHEGMEDSPVARWARELRDALGGEKHDPAEDVSMSAHDLLPQEDREAIAWVREHGGLDAVKRRWECLSYYADPVPRSCMEKRLARLQRQIDESHAALRRRRGIISELNRRACDLTRENAELRKRAMPDGMCWPVFEDGEPVRIGDVVSDVEVRSVVFRDGGILLSDCTSVPGWGTWRSYKEPIKRPAPKVLDSEGVECNVGDAVWWVHNKTGNFRIIRIEQDGKCAIHDDDADEPCGMTVPSTELTHKRPVLDADGAEIRVGDTVWAVGEAWPSMKVLEIKADDDPDVPEHLVWCGEMCSEPLNDTKKWRIANQLTHRAPVLAADGKPLREGETVYHVETGAELVVKKLPKPGEYQAVVVFALPASLLTSFDPDKLTHERPDSWERLEEDAANLDEMPCDYSAKDLVRRARALAERERGA